MLTEIGRRLAEVLYRRPLQSLLAGGAAVLALVLVSCLALVVAGTVAATIWVHRQEPGVEAAVSLTPIYTRQPSELLSPLATPQLPPPLPDGEQALPTLPPPAHTPAAIAPTPPVSDTTGAAAQPPAEAVDLLAAAPTLQPVDVPAPEAGLELTPTSQLTLAAVIMIENVGQFPDEVRYQVRSSSGGGLWLAADALWMTLLGPPQDEIGLAPRPQTAIASAPLPVGDARPRQGVGLRFGFEGANPKPELVAFRRLDTQVSYFAGPDPAGWQAGVPVWGGVRYVDLYPGIDLELAAEEGRYVHRLVFHAGADPGSVRLRIEGASDLDLVPGGQPGEGSQLRVTTALGEIRWPLFEAVAPDGSPAALSPAPAPRLTDDDVVEAPFYLPTRGGVGAARALAIGTAGEGADLDLGGLLDQAGNDGGYDVAVDAARNVYVAGYTYRPAALGPAGPFDALGAAVGSLDACVVKMGAGGRSLAYVAFWGGSGDEVGRAIAVDGGGSVYVAGTTRSPDLAVTAGASGAGLEGAYRGGYDAFAFKLDAAGTALVYATYLGGSGDDRGRDVAIDRAGSLYLVGDTTSPDLPVTAGAWDTDLAGQDAFVAKLDPSGSQLAYATYLGGAGLDGAGAIALDEAGQASVTGVTHSADWPATAGAFDTQLGGSEDAFVARLNGAGTGLVYATYLGGGEADYGGGIALDAAGCAYVAGATRSADFPTTAWAFDGEHDGGWDAFVAKLAPAGDGLAYAAFVGGSGDDWGQGISLDGGGYAYLAGSSQDLPREEAGSDGSQSGDAHDVFVTRVDEFGASLAHTSVLGSAGEDYAAAIAVDTLGSVYLVGMTESAAGESDAGGLPGAVRLAGGFVSRLAMGSPFLDLPLAYDNFALAALGNVGDRGPGRVNSWFDHSYPTHTRNRNLTRWDGATVRFDASSPPRIGESWYDGHGGTDFGWETLQDPILAAAPGLVIDTVTTCRVGNPACGSGFGNRVWLDHGNGYATVYAHLKTVQVTVGTEISDPAGQPLGIMGNTGRSLGIHLHFGVYFDANSDGRWTRDEVVDPYGWAGEGDDPWHGSSYYLWKHPLSTRALLDGAPGQQRPNGGWQLLSPSGLVTLTIPAAALTSTVVLELGDMPPAAAPEAGWRTTGHSFSLSAVRPADGAAEGFTFLQPVMVTMRGWLEDLPHLDASQASLRRWDEVRRTWVALPAGVDKDQGQITAQTSELGRFDLHAPLLCPADVHEPDDHYGAAQTILANGSRIVRLFDIRNDVDWFLFEARAGRLYRAEIRSLADGVDPRLKLYESDTVAPLGAATPTGTSGRRQLLWRAPMDGAYLLQASQAAGSAYGCDAGYELTVVEVQAPLGVTLAGPTRGKVQASYVFTATVSPQTVTLPITYTWQVAGQPAPDEGEGLAHLGSLTHALSLTWSISGSHRLVITATNAAGSASAAQVIDIQPALAADWIASPTTGLAPLKVLFTNRSVGGYDNSLWDMGDGTTSRSESPSHTYELPGVYTVTLTVSGPGGRDTLTRSQYIRVREPVPAAGEYSVYLPLIRR